MSSPISPASHVSPTVSPALASSPASQAQPALRPDLRLDLSAVPVGSIHAGTPQYTPATATSAGSQSPSSPSSVGSLPTPSDTFMTPIYPTTNSFHMPLKSHAPPSYCANSLQRSQGPAPLPFPIVRKLSIASSASSSSESPTSPGSPGMEPDASYRFPPLPAHTPASGVVRSQSSSSYRIVHPSVGPAATIAAGGRVTISHPYARLHAKNHDSGGTSKRRRMWSHALEKSVFTPHELSTVGAPHRRTIYTASMEAHVDGLHAQLLEYALFPVPFEQLEAYRGLNSKTAKSMVAGLQKDMNDMKVKLLELQRVNHTLRSCTTAFNKLHEYAPSYASSAPGASNSGRLPVMGRTPPRRHSLGTSEYPYSGAFGGTCAR
ncbi:hypothetical protein EUX98_g4114 [Antrodiella citrinella]|uniref:Uncharacterized protein n=1 Tax=Antrodiella citrinella TaxID=2447956 RepID=A0A4S4N2U9_9APHY|nr:hypothetical protein EUX98_g4114 [Antrodiella citrinella]